MGITGLTFKLTSPSLSLFLQTSLLIDKSLFYLFTGLFPKESKDLLLKSIYLFLSPEITSGSHFGIPFKDEYPYFIIGLIYVT